MVGALISALLLTVPIFHLQSAIWAGTLLRKDMGIDMIGAACVIYSAAVVFVTRVQLAPFAV